MCKVTFALSVVIVSSNGGRQSRDKLSDVTEKKLGCLIHSQSCQSMLSVWLHCQGTHCLSAGGCAPELTSHVALLISSSAASRLYQQIGWFFRHLNIHRRTSIPDPLQRSRPSAAERCDGGIDLHIDVSSTDTDTWAQTICPWWNTVLLLSWILG